MAADNTVVLQVKVRALGDAPKSGKPLDQGWLYLLQGSQVRVMHTNLRGLTLFDSTGTAPRDQWWQFNTLFKANLGTTLKACFSRGARPVPNALLVPELFSDVQVVPAPPPSVTVTDDKTGQQKTHSLGFRLGSIELIDVGTLLQVPQELSVWPVTAAPVLIGDAYFTQGLLQGKDLGVNVSKFPKPPDFDPNRRPAVDTKAQVPGTAIPLRGLKVSGTVNTKAGSVKVSLQGADGNAIELRAAENMESVPAVDARLAGGRFDTELFFSPDLSAPVLVAGFGLVDLIISVVAEGRTFLESFALHLCGAELGVVDDSDNPTQGRGRRQTGADEQHVVDFKQPHASTGEPPLGDQARAQRLNCYLIRSQFDPTGVTPTTLPPDFMLELRFIGLSRASLGQLGMHRYRRETGGLVTPLFGGGANPPADGVARVAPRVTVSFRLSWDFKFVIDWRARNDDLQDRSYGTKPFEVIGSGAAHLRIDENGGVFGPGFEDLRAADSVIPLAMDPQPTVTGRRNPELRVDQNLVFGRHNSEPPRPSLIFESLPIFTEAPIPRDAGVVSLLAQRQQVLSPRPALVPALHGGYGDVSLTRLELGFSDVDKTEATLRAPDGDLVEREPTDPNADTIGVLAARVGGPARVVPPRAPPLSAPLIRIAGRNIDQPSALKLMERFVREMIPAGGLFFISQNCWVLTAQAIFLKESGARMFNPETFLHITTISVKNKTVRFGVEAGEPVFGPPNGYGVCQLDPPTNAAKVTPDEFGKFDRRLWDYDTHIERGVELIIAKARDAFSRFQAGRHYTTVTRKNTLDKAGNVVIVGGSTNNVQTTRARDEWVKIRNTPLGRAMLQREITRGFGGGFEFTFFVDKGRWDIWSTPAKLFWDIHVDNKLHSGSVVARSEDAGVEGQGTFDPSFFGPGVQEAGVL